MRSTDVYGRYYTNLSFKSGLRMNIGTTHFLSCFKVEADFAAFLARVCSQVCLSQYLLAI